MSTSNHPFDVLLTGAEVFIQKPGTLIGRLEKAVIAIKNGKIAEINPRNPQAQKTLNMSGLTIFPGWIDSQVHFREPGLEHKEDLAHGSAAAAQGGITAFFEMPNTKPNTCDQAQVEEKVARARQKSHVDFAFYAGANGDNTAELNHLEKLPGVCGIKIFMGSSTGTLLVDTDEALDRILATVKRRPAIHAEDEPRLNERKHIAEEAPGVVTNHPIWRDEITALKATQRALRLAKKHNRPVHILHVTTAEEMALLKEHRDIATVETTPQHLTLFAPDCYEQLGTLAQMNPPIRNLKHQDALWKAVNSGVVDVLGSDHAPHTYSEKKGVYPATPSGMPGVQTIAPLMLDHVSKGNLELTRLNQLLSTRPCEIWGIEGRGYIEPGFEATFSIFDLKLTREVTPDWLKSKCGWSPFEGRKLTGWPIHTMIRGEFALQDEVLTSFRGSPLKFNR